MVGSLYECSEGYHLVRKMKSDRTPVSKSVHYRSNFDERKKVRKCVNCQQEFGVGAYNFFEFARRRSIAL